MGDPLFEINSDQEQEQRVLCHPITSQFRSCADCCEFFGSRETDKAPRMICWPSRRRNVLSLDCQSAFYTEAVINTALLVL